MRGIRKRERDLEEDLTDGKNNLIRKIMDEET